MSTARLAPVTLLALVVAGCGQTQARTQHTYRTLALKPHQAFVVTLPSNRSTGYRWVETTGSTPNDVGARLLSRRYVAPAAGVSGSDGKEIWRFRAVGRGALPLGFAYVLPADRRKPAARFVGLSIVVG